MVELKVEHVVSAVFWDNMEKQIGEVENAMCAMELVWKSIEETPGADLNDRQALRSMVDYLDHIVFKMRGALDDTHPFDAARIAEVTA